jgi:uncharacterized protein YciI
MGQLFAVMRTHGSNWNDAAPLEGQRDWASHAAFMDALAAEGFVLLGGPLESTPDTLLVIRAADAGEVRARLSADPWEPSDILRTVRIDPWTLRLGGLKR